MNLVLTTSLVGVAVVASKEKAHVGTIASTFFDIERGLVIGFTITPGWLKASLFVYLDDFVSLNRSAMVVKSKDRVLPLEKVEEVKSLGRKGVKLIGLKVVNQSGKTLGKVSDLAISLENGLIIRLFIGSLWGDRVIPREKIVQITRKKIIIDDDNRVADALPETA